MDASTSPQNKELMAEEEEHRLDGRSSPSAADVSPEDNASDVGGGQHDDIDEPEDRASDSKPSHAGAASSTSSKNVPKDSVSETAPASQNRPHKRKKRDVTMKKKPRNELTHLIPGYTAPLALNSSSLDPYRPAGGLEAIRQQALARDHPAAKFSASLRRTRSVDYGTGHGPPAATKAWFQERSTPVTDQVKKDLQLLRNRNYLDPKRFYKSNDPVGKFVQVGTVIEGSSEFYSSRLTKKQRRTNLLDEVLADADTSRYAQDKYKKMQREKTAEAQKRRRFRGKGRGPQKRR
jgi:Fcf2 pre-rRNA processing